MLLQEEIKARKHPGKCGITVQPLPDDLIQSIIRTLKGYTKKNILKNLFFILVFIIFQMLN